MENHKEGDLPRRKFGPRESPRDDGPCLLGPVAVRGAEPGSVLEVHVEAVVPGAWGWTVAGEIGFFNAGLNRALGVAEGPPRTTRWRLDVDAMTTTGHHGHDIRLRPFLGAIGLSPAASGWHSAWPPGRTGGNLDCKELTARSTLYLAVALRARTPDGWITFGFGEDLDEAAANALNGMLDLMMSEYGLCQKDTIALASPVVDLRVTQLVNGIRDVHAVLPHEAIR